MTMFDRRTVIAGAAALAANPTVGFAKRALDGTFPEGFLWGAATAPHQIEGNNTNSDIWYLENQKPTFFAEPSGDAANSLFLWERDLDLAKSLGLNCYRFGIEWARIEPERGRFSQAMIDHYSRVIDGCLERGLKPIVTFSHFTSPLWFSSQSGWVHADGPSLFARFTEKAARALADRMAIAITLNEPNLPIILKMLLPDEQWKLQEEALAVASRKLGASFIGAIACTRDQIPDLQRGLLAAHVAGRAAIKAVRPSLQVGVSLSMADEQAVGRNSLRDAKRQELYGAWLDLARHDDFVGVQNYYRTVWNDVGVVSPPKDTDRDFRGQEVYAPSLGNAVRYAHEQTGVPVLVSEHGVGTDDDSIRARLIPEALSGLKLAINQGVPVIGYCHWSLIDNFEWTSGYAPKFGLASVNPGDFTRHPKPSAEILRRIALANGLGA